MEWIEMKEKFDRWDALLIPKQKRYIHFNSMKNFIFHYNSLPDENIRREVALILNEYIQDVENNHCDFAGAESCELTRKYMNKISGYYTAFLGFKSILIFRFVLIFGIIGDGIFYLLFHNYLRFYFPPVLICLLCYYVYVKCAFEKSGRLFGIYY